MRLSKGPWLSASIDRLPTCPLLYWTTLPWSKCLHWANILWQNVITWLIYYLYPINQSNSFDPSLHWATIHCPIAFTEPNTCIVNEWLSCGIMPALSDCSVVQYLHLANVQWHDTCVERLSWDMMPPLSDSPLAAHCLH